MPICKLLKKLAGTTGLEPAVSAVTARHVGYFQQLTFSAGAASRCKESFEAVSRVNVWVEFWMINIAWWDMQVAIFDCSQGSRASK